MVATTNILNSLSLLFVAILLLGLSRLAMAASPNLEDAQTHCAEPAHQLSRALDEAVGMSGQVLDDKLRGQFLKHFEQCRAIYRYHLQRLAEEFTDLPADAYCHSVRREFIEAESLFDVAANRAIQLPLASDEDRQAAAAFLRQASSTLLRTLNGLFLLRHGICMEERIVPFDHPPFESDINRTYPHIE